MKKILLTIAMIFSLVSGTALADIHLTEENTVSLRGRVDTTSVTNVSYEILTKEASDLYLFIDSPGGSVFAGLQLVYLLKNLPEGKNVTCISNFAASMAFAITQACPKRLILPQSVLMQHVASYSLRGQEPNNLSFARFIRKVSNYMDRFQAKRMGMNLKTFKKKVRDDWWLVGQESLKHDAADGWAGTVTCSSEMVKASDDVEVQSSFWVVKMSFSKCPLIRGTIKKDASRIGTIPSREANQELINITRWYEPSLAIDYMRENPGKNLTNVSMIRTN